MKSAEVVPNPVGGNTVNGAMSPATVAGYAAALATAETQASNLRGEVERLKQTDSTNPAIERVEKQILQFKDLRQEVNQTSAAIVKLGSGLDMSALNRWAEDATRGSTAVAANLKEAEVTSKGLPGLLGKISGGWLGLGAAVGGVGLLGFVNQTLEAAGAVEDLADRLGMGIEEVQVWSAFTHQAGASTEDLSAATKGLANAMQGAVNGGKEQKAAFDALGISTDGWKNKLPSLTETLALVGGRLGELDNEGQRLALTQKLLSEGGLKLSPAFKGGTEAVQEHLEKLKELAVVYSDDFVKSAGEAGDELDLFYGQFRGLGSELILTFLPALRSTVRELTPMIRGFRDGFKNTELFKGILAAAGITALASFGGMGAILARIGPILWSLALAARPFLWAFAKFAFLALIIDDLWVTLNGGKSVIGDVLGSFSRGQSTLDAMRSTFKLLKGSVLLLWGALSGKQEYIDKGKALIDEFSAWADSAFVNIQAAWEQFWGEDFPAIVDGGLDESGVSIERSLDDWLVLIETWAKKSGVLLADVWGGAIDGLLELIRLFGNLLAMIPGLDSLGSDAPEGDLSEWQPISPSKQREKAALIRARNASIYGSEVNPLTLGAGTSTSVNNVSYAPHFETKIETRNERETLAAMYKTEQNYTSAIKDNRQVLRLVKGGT